MSRAVVFKTKGKLDLRSLTVFGMNAKPETTTPIGYFGTGLKYAVAVLARQNIPVTFWIEGKKWTVEKTETKFRDKGFSSLYLKNDRQFTFSRALDLPFTTEFAKNWDLWQAFRELESNTRDEKGMTFVGEVRGDDVVVTSGIAPEVQNRDKGFTCICVESEDFVQEYLDREKTFLPEGMTERDSTDRVQCFARKSKHIYYRSIRIMDLPEPSENTYNILCPVELTEDRTAKSEFNVKWEIQNYLASHAPKTIIERAVKAPNQTFERKLDYQYASKSDLFLDTIQEAGENATQYAKSALKTERPPEVLKVSSGNWKKDLIYAIDQGQWDEVERIIDDGHRAEMIQMLTKSISGEDYDKLIEQQTDDIVNGNYGVPRGTEQEAGGSKTGRLPGVSNHISEADDNIPF